MIVVNHGITLAINELLDIKTAAHLMWQRYADVSWLMSIGIGKTDDERDCIYFYLKRKPLVGNVPTEWMGFPVVSRVVGQVRPCSA